MAISIDGTNGLTTDNAALKLDGTTLVVDDTNNRVGIGVTNPSSFNADANNLVVGSGTGNNGITVYGSSAGFGGLYFADGTLTNQAKTGYINYDYSNEVMRFHTSGTERMSIDSSANLKFNSGYGSVATAYGCRAWVNFQGGNGTINGSGNVSSVTDDGTGRYSVNFTTSMPDANYSVAGMGQRNGTVDGGIVQIASSGTTISGQTTAGVAIHTKNLTDSDRDFTTVMVQVVR